VSEWDLPATTGGDTCALACHYTIGSAAGNQPPPSCRRDDHLLGGQLAHSMQDPVCALLESNQQVNLIQINAATSPLEMDEDHRDVVDHGSTLLLNPPVPGLLGKLVCRHHGLVSCERSHN